MDNKYSKDNMKKAFDAIDEISEFLDLEPDNEDMEDMVRCNGGYVGFYNGKGTSIRLPFDSEGIDYDSLSHVIKIIRNFRVDYPRVIQQEVVLEGVETKFSISTSVIVVNYNDLLPQLKSCLEQFNKIKIDSQW
jgi:hypothetical protein